MIEAAAVALVILPIVNSLFVFDSIRRYLRVERHPILLVIVAVKVGIWVLGIAMGYFAIEFLMDPHPVTGLATVFAWALVVVQLIPGFIWVVLRRYEA